VFELTVAYACKFLQICYGVRCVFDTFGHQWSLLHSSHTSNKRCFR